MRMPDPDQGVIARRLEIARDLTRLLPDEGAVIVDDDGCRPYETDGLSCYRQMPMIVVLPANTAEVAAVLRYCHDNHLKVVPRGAGTSLSGGALPLADGVLLGLARLNTILDIDLDNRCAVVQAGVTNLAISGAVAADGYYYAPDPSSQITCTIGGNVAENAGGVHCLKYGLTTNNILGLTVVLTDGEVVTLGGKHMDPGGYDLVGLLTGAEGMLGVVTEVVVRLLRKPEFARAVMLGFPSNEAAGATVAAIIGAGIIPGGLEMMDKPAIHAADAYSGAGYPLDVEALLIVEPDGPEAEVEALIERVTEIGRANGAVHVSLSQSEEQRLRFWSGRKAAFPAIGRLAPDYFVMDGSIPRGRLAEVFTAMREMSSRYGLRVANVFHAGDGNLHPLILFDANDADQMARAEAFGAEILKLCVAVGGCLTGEHGVGVEKRDLMPFMFSDEDLRQQLRVKRAFDPHGILNPGKVFPRFYPVSELDALGPVAATAGQ